MEEALEARAAERAHQADLRHRYQMYIDQQADAHLDGMDPVERDRLLNAKAVALRARYPHATFWKADTLAAIARASARQDLVARLPLMDFKSFAARYQFDGDEWWTAKSDSSSVSNG